MRGVLKYQIGGWKDTWNNGLSNEVLRAAIAFPVLVVLAFILCMVFPAMREVLLSYVFAAMNGTGALNDDGTLNYFVYPYVEYDGQFNRAYYKFGKEPPYITFNYTVEEDAGCNC